MLTEEAAALVDSSVDRETEPGVYSGAILVEDDRAELLGPFPLQNMSVQVLYPLSTCERAPLSRNLNSIVPERTGDDEFRCIFGLNGPQYMKASASISSVT
jgi:hypothetical protein